MLQRGYGTRLSVHHTLAVSFAAASTATPSQHPGSLDRLGAAPLSTMSHLHWVHQQRYVLVYLFCYSGFLKPRESWDRLVMPLNSDSSMLDTVAVTCATFVLSVRFANYPTLALHHASIPTGNITLDPRLINSICCKLHWDPVGYWLIRVTQ